MFFYGGLLITQLFLGKQTLNSEPVNAYNTTKPYGLAFILLVVVTLPKNTSVVVKKTGEFVAGLSAVLLAKHLALEPWRITSAVSKKNPYSGRLKPRSTKLREY
jgi:hypothetical protein